MKDNGPPTVDALIANWPPPTEWSLPELEATFDFCAFAFLETDLRRANSALYDLIEVDAKYRRLLEENRELKQRLAALLKLSCSGRQPGLMIAQQQARALLAELGVEVGS